MKKQFTILTLAFFLPQGAIAQDQHPIEFDKVEWQSATLEDMQVFAPYIGTFRGKTHTRDDGTAFFFTVAYEYYDTPKSVVKYTLKTHFPETGEVRPLGEGFYIFDRFSERIAVHGIFKDGRYGTGFLTPFDRQSGEREVRIHAKSLDGEVTQVRDTFVPIDGNSWKNITFISRNGSDWQKVSEDIYRRLEN